MIAGLAIGILCFRNLFSLTLFTGKMTINLVIIFAICVLIFWIFRKITRHIVNKVEAKQSIKKSKLLILNIMLKSTRFHFDGIECF